MATRSDLDITFIGTATTLLLHHARLTILARSGRDGGGGAGSGCYVAFLHFAPCAPIACWL